MTEPILLTDVAQAHVNIRVTVVGTHDRPLVTWPALWPVPVVGSAVMLPNKTLVWVRTVTYYPYGEDISQGRRVEPHIAVIVGPKL